MARSPAFAEAELSTGWVEEHWDGPSEFARAARLALLAAGLDAIASGDATTIGGRPMSPAAGSGGTGDDGWRRAAREAAIDRWPG